MASRLEELRTKALGIYGPDSQRSTSVNIHIQKREMDGWESAIDLPLHGEDPLDPSAFPVTLRDTVRAVRTMIETGNGGFVRVPTLKTPADHAVYAHLVMATTSACRDQKNPMSTLTLPGAAFQHPTVSVQNATGYYKDWRIYQGAVAKNNWQDLRNGTRRLVMEDPDLGKVRDRILQLNGSNDHAVIFAHESDLPRLKEFDAGAHSKIPRVGNPNAIADFPIGAPSDQDRLLNIAVNNTDILLGAPENTGSWGQAGQEDALRTVTQWALAVGVGGLNVPGLILCGPFGVGKSVALRRAMAIARQVAGDSQQWRFSEIPHWSGDTDRERRVIVVDDKLWYPEPGQHPTSNVLDGRMADPRKTFATATNAPGSLLKEKIQTIPSFQVRPPIVVNMQGNDWNEGFDPFKK